MRKIMCYAWVWCVFVAGTATVLPGQTPVLPPFPVAPDTAGPAAPAPVPMPSAEGTAAPTQGHEPVPAPTADVPAGATDAPISAGPPMAVSRGPLRNYRAAYCTGVKPLGACVCEHVCTQVHNGIVAQLALYNYDFNDPAIGDPAKLSPYGLRRLNAIGTLVRAGACSAVMIERTMGNPALDSARQMNVSLAMGETGLSPQVVIADTPAGLSGAESLLIYRNQLRQTAAEGTTLPRQTSSGTGTGSGGGSLPGTQGTSQ